MYSFFKDRKWRLWAYCGATGLIALLVLQTLLAVWLNTWYRDFYDILQNVEDHRLREFWDSLFVFLRICLPYIFIIAITNFLSRTYALRWRQSMAEGMVDLWLKTDKQIEGASQRIQQDSERFAKIVESLGLEVVRGGMVLIAFLPILWGLSKELELPLIGEIPGSLVWVALIISIGGIVVSWFVGKKLPRLEYNNQKTEAAYRKNLVLGEDKRAHCTNESLFGLFTGLRKNHERLFLHLSYFDLWSSLYGQTVVIIPYLIGGIGLFSGILTLGMLVQIANCFGKVHESFAIVLNRWTAITELRSIHLRLTEFYKLIEEGDI
ncbi:MAG: putative transporter [Desulfobacterales bacterium]|nr:putative transporter [Desulfobacterales bacterium]